MLRYVVTRIGQGIVTAFVLLTAVFIFARISGNPINLVVPPDATLATRHAAAVRLGLTQSYFVQYGKFVGNLLKGNFGTSIQFNLPTTQLFLGAAPATARLALVALAFAVVIGVPLGVVSAVNRGKLSDYLARSWSALAMSAPEFWVGIMLILLFAVNLKILPAEGDTSPQSYLLPAFTLSLPVLAGTARLVRSSLIDVLGSEYIKLARIKGASNAAVIWKHGLRNALLPVVTFLGIRLSALLCGSVVVEAVFAWPGVGRLMYECVSGQDYPLEQGLLLLLGFIVIGMNLVVDILYTVIDPRIRIRPNQAR
jgi:peptide/nickel transport system permease protein